VEHTLWSNGSFLLLGDLFAGFHQGKKAKGRPKHSPFWEKGSFLWKIGFFYLIKRLIEKVWLLIKRLIEVK
jgi:hypothetical protein